MESCSEETAAKGGRRKTGANYLVLIKESVLTYVAIRLKTLQLIERTEASSEHWRGAQRRQDSSGLHKPQGAG
jgi:hypothetical protein